MPAAGGYDGTLHYRVERLEARIERLEALERTSQLAVLEERVKTIAEDVRVLRTTTATKKEAAEQAEEQKSLRRSFYTFAFGSVAAALTFAISVLLIFGQ